MKYLFFFLFLSTSVFAQQKSNYFIKFKTQVQSQRAKKSGTSLSDSLAKWGIKLNPIVRGGRVKKSSSTDILKIYSFRFTDAEFDKIKTTLQNFDEVLLLEKEPVVNLLYYPNDPYASKDSTGGQVQTPVVSHNFYDVWEIEKGDPNITIGMVDTGVWFDHEDIQANIKYNTNDPINGTNDDNDSLQGMPLIDNYRGWDLADWDNDPTPPAGQDHGLSVAGIASATPDNNKGVTGLAFNTSYMPLKASSDASSNNLSAGYVGILYAAEHNCRVINLSWGGDTYPGQIFQDVINYAVDEFDVVIVAAAGNSAKDEAYFPASFDNVLSVTAIRPDSVMYNISTYNYKVDFNAVGWNSKALRRWSVSSYSNVSATSFSTPVVSATVALLASKQPTFTSQQIVRQLRVSALVIDTIPANLAYKDKMGKMLDPVRALSDFTIPGLEVTAISVPDSLSFPEAGGLVNVTIQLKNILADANNITVSVASLDPVFSFSQTDFTGITVPANGTHTINTQLVVPAGIANSSGEFPLKVSFLGTDYHDYEVRMVNYLYPCPTTHYTVTTENLSCVTNDGQLIFNVLTNGTEYSFHYQVNGVVKDSTATVTNGTFVFDSLQTGSYDKISIDSLQCSVSFDTTLTLVRQLTAEVTTAGSGEIQFTNLTENTPYIISYLYNDAESAFIKTSDNTGQILLSNLVQGDYKNIKIDSSGCSSLLTNLTVEVVSGINLEEYGLKIFPNPFDNQLEIETRHPNTTLFIYSIDGKLVREMTTTTKTTNLDLSALSQGVYLLVIKNKDATTTHQLIKR